MSAKWAMSGAESISKVWGTYTMRSKSLILVSDYLLQIYPGAPHGFSFFPVGGTETTEQGLNDIAMFMNERIAASVRQSRA